MNDLGCTGVDHPALAAKDPAGMAKWYCEKLDYKVYFHHREKNAFIIEAPDRTFIEIMPQDATPRPARTVCTPGWSHLAMRVKNIDHASKVLEGRGVKFHADAFPSIGGGRVRNFSDPEDNLVQIVERPDR